MSDVRPDEEGGRNGFVLLPILAVVLVFAMVSAGMAARSRIRVLQENNRVESTKLQAQADGIVRLVAAHLAQESPAFDVTGQWSACQKGATRVAVSVTDQDMLLDLNGAPLEMLEDVFAVSGLPESTNKKLASEIVDYRDADDMSQPLYGAERIEYQRAGLAWGPRNDYFADPSEFGQLPGATADLQSALSPILSIYNGRAAIDPQIIFRTFGQTTEIRQRLDKWTVKSRGERFSIEVEASVKGRSAVSRLAVISRAGEGKPPTFVKWSRTSHSLDPESGKASGKAAELPMVCDWMKAAGIENAADAAAK